MIQLNYTITLPDYPGKTFTLIEKHNDPDGNEYFIAIDYVTELEVCIYFMWDNEKMMHVPDLVIELKPLP